MTNNNFRTEKGSMGTVKVPADALYRAQTQRAVNNFPVSGLRFSRAMIEALGGQMEYLLIDKMYQNTFHAKIKVVTQEGDERTIAFYNNVTHDEEGRVTGVLFSGTDITDRKKGEAALKASEEKYRNLVDNAPVGVFTSKLDGEILFVNDAMARLLGYTDVDEVKGRNATSYYANPSDRKNMIETLRNSGRVINFETRFLTASGGTRDVLLSAVLTAERLSGTVMDITERIRLEQELRQSEMFLNDVGRIGQIGGWEMDLVTRKAKWTSGTYYVVGLGWNDPIPGLDGHLDYYLPEYRPMVAEAMRALIEDDKPLAFEARWMHGNPIDYRDLGGCYLDEVPKGGCQVWLGTEGALNPPTNLQANFEAHQVKLRWTPSPDAIQYRIIRHTGTKIRLENTRCCVLALQSVKNLASTCSYGAIH